MSIRAPRSKKRKPRPGKPIRDPAADRLERGDPVPYPEHLPPMLEDPPRLIIVPKLVRKK